VLATLAALALAAAPPAPLAVVKSADTEVQKILSEPEVSTTKLAERADEFIDFFELARRAMGDEWPKLSKKQQDEFSTTMKGLLRANYAQKAVTDGRGGAKVEYGKELVEGNEATVETKLLVKKDAFPVVYKLYRVDPKSGWRIYDVITDEVSLVATYADQFRTVMGKKGFDGLLKSLKAKQEQLEKQQTASKATPEQGAGK
jgi:phospholipid transport system substrate-binding protein